MQNQNLKQNNMIIQYGSKKSSSKQSRDRY